MHSTLWWKWETFALLWSNQCIKISSDHLQKLEFSSRLALNQSTTKILANLNLNTNFHWFTEPNIHPKSQIYHFTAKKSLNKPQNPSASFSHNQGNPNPQTQLNHIQNQSKHTKVKTKQIPVPRIASSRASEIPHGQENQQTYRRKQQRGRLIPSPPLHMHWEWER